jgi:hypothetical protein
LGGSGKNCARDYEGLGSGLVLFERSFNHLCEFYRDIVKINAVFYLPKYLHISFAPIALIPLSL